MIGDLADHRADHAELVGVLGNIRIELADLHATLAVAGELEGRGEDVADPIALGFLQLLLHGVGYGLAVQFREVVLGIEGVDLGGATVHEQVDDALGFAGELGGGCGQRVAIAGADRAEEIRSREGTEAEAGIAEEVAAGEGHG